MGRYAGYLKNVKFELLPTGDKRIAVSVFFYYDNISQKEEKILYLPCSTAQTFLDIVLSSASSKISVPFDMANLKLAEDTLAMEKAKK